MSPFGVNSGERVSLFFDGANFYSACKSLGLEVDYKRMREHFKENCTLVRAFYYTSVNEDSEVQTIRPLLDFLDYNGYSVVTKPTKEFVDSLGRRKVKGSLDVEITVDLLEAASYSDHIILFSGDGDFRRAVAAAQSKGTQITVVSTLGGDGMTSMVADELRRQADNFVDLRSVASTIHRDAPSQRAVNADDRLGVERTVRARPQAPAAPAPNTATVQRVTPRYARP